jgi:P-type Cu2+ transporter
MTEHPAHTKHEHKHSEATAVLEVSGVHWGIIEERAEAVLSRRPGCFRLTQPVAQTATVTYDPARTSVTRRGKGT